MRRFTFAILAVGLLSPVVLEASDIMAGERRVRLALPSLKRGDSEARVKEVLGKPTYKGMDWMRISPDSDVQAQFWSYEFFPDDEHVITWIAVFDCHRQYSCFMRTERSANEGFSWSRKEMKGVMDFTASLPNMVRTMFVR